MTKNLARLSSPFRPKRAESSSSAQSGTGPAATSTRRPVPGTSQQTLSHNTKLWLAALECRDKRDRAAARAEREQRAKAKEAQREQQAKARERKRLAKEAEREAERAEVAKVSAIAAARRARRAEENKFKQPKDLMTAWYMKQAWPKITRRNKTHDQQQQ